MTPVGAPDGTVRSAGAGVPAAAGALFGQPAGAGPGGRVPLHQHDPRGRPSSDFRPALRERHPAEGHRRDGDHLVGGLRWCASKRRAPPWQDHQRWRPGWGAAVVGPGPAAPRRSCLRFPQVDRSPPVRPRRWVWLRPVLACGHDGQHTGPAGGSGCAVRSGRCPAYRWPRTDRCGECRLVALARRAAVDDRSCAPMCCVDYGSTLSVLRAAVASCAPGGQIALEQRQRPARPDRP